MSRENVEAVRIAYDLAYAQRSVEGVRDRFAADFRWHSRPEWPGQAEYTVDNMTDLWADLDETFEEYSLAPASFEPLGAYVLVTVDQSTRLRASGDRLETRIYHLWRVEAGQPQETWSFGTREEALETAGLGE